MNLYRKVVLHHFNFKQPVYDIKYSPNGRSVPVGPFMLSCLVCNLSVMSRQMIEAIFPVPVISL